MKLDKHAKEDGTYNFFLMKNFNPSIVMILLGWVG